MCRETIFIKQGIIPPPMFYLFIAFRVGTVRSNETSVNCQPTCRFVSSHRTRPGHCEFFLSDSLFNVLLLLTLHIRTSVSVIKRIKKT